jgi:hypothetical protein
MRTVLRSAIGAVALAGVMSTAPAYAAFVPNTSVLCLATDAAFTANLICVYDNLAGDLNSAAGQVLYLNSGYAGSWNLNAAIASATPGVGLADPQLQLSISAASLNPQGAPLYVGWAQTGFEGSTDLIFTYASSASPFSTSANLIYRQDGVVGFPWTTLATLGPASGLFDLSTSANAANADGGTYSLGFIVSLAQGTGTAVVNANVVPAPGVLALFGVGLLGISALRRRKADA